MVQPWTICIKNLIESFNISPFQPSDKFFIAIYRSLRQNMLYYPTQKYKLLQEYSFWKQINVQLEIGGQVFESFNYVFIEKIIAPYKINIENLT